MESVGNFRGTVIDGAVGLSSGGFAQAVIKVHAEEMYDAENKEWGKWDEFDWEPNEVNERDAIAYVIIFGNKGATLSCDELKKIFGWEGTSLAQLDGLIEEGTKIQWRNETNTYQGDTKIQVAFISEYDAAPGGSVKKLDKKGLADLDAKFAGFLKGETKPEKAATGKRSRRKAAAETEAPVEEEKTEEPKAEKPKRAARGSKAKAKAKAKAPAAEPPAESAAPPEEEATVEEQADDVFANNGPCTKDEAWADINSNKGDTADADVASAWMKAIQDVGGGKKQKELSDDEWGSIRAAVIDIVATF